MADAHHPLTGGPQYLRLEVQVEPLSLYILVVHGQKAQKAPKTPTIETEQPGYQREHERINHHCRVYYLFYYY